MTYFPEYILTKRKTTDETRNFLTNEDEVLTADSTLRLSLPAGNWLLSARIYVDTTIAAGIRFLLTGTNVVLSPTSRLNTMANGQPAGDPLLISFLARFATFTPFIVPGDNATHTAQIIQLDFSGDLVVASGSTADVTPWWCQDISNDDCTIKKHSYLQAMRLP